MIFVRCYPGKGARNFGSLRATPPARAIAVERFQEPRRPFSCCSHAALLATTGDQAPHPLESALSQGERIPSPVLGPMAVPRTAPSSLALTPPPAPPTQDKEIEHYTRICGSPAPRLPSEKALLWWSLPQNLCPAMKLTRAGAASDIFSPCSE